MNDEKKETIDSGILPLGTQATLTWLDTDGKETNSELCPRSMPSILSALEAHAAEDPDDNVKVSLKVAEANKDGEPETAEIDLAEGKWTDVIEDVRKRVLPAEQALMQFHLSVSKLMDLSSLKGVMITAVFEDASATGFTVLSESSPVDIEDIKVLGASASAQAADFKYKMREGDLKIEFPDDKGTIILPGDTGAAKLT